MPSHSLFLFSVSWCQLSILDVFLFELFRNGSALLPLYMYLYVCMCVCPNAMANMEVSMSVVDLKRENQSEDCFVLKTMLYLSRYIDLPWRGYHWQLYNTNSDIRTFIHSVSFADLFRERIFKHDNWTFVSLFQTLRIYERLRKWTSKNKFWSYVNSLTCSWTRREDSRGNTWYFMLRSS